MRLDALEPVLAVTNDGLIVADIVAATPIDAHVDTPMQDEGVAVPNALMIADGVVVHATGIYAGASDSAMPMLLCRSPCR